jgi:hypothetical protein
MDATYPDDFALNAIRGYAEPHALTIALGRTRPSLLLLTGWTDYAFSSDNVAAAQAGLAMQPPALDARGADGRETPAASFALVRLIGSEIEVLRLGDCLVLLEASDGAVTVMDHPVLAAIEAATRSALLALRAQGITDPKQAFTAMMPRLRAERQRRNLADGYGVLAAERSCLPMLHLDRMPAHDVRRVLLASDGYYRLVDHYNAASDAELVRRTEELGADAMLEQLRAIEVADPLATRYPRLKIADDATALLIGVNQR